MKNFDYIGKPVFIGNVELKNRIIFAPTTMGLRKEEYYKKIEAIAKGGCSLIIIGDVPVGKSNFGFSLFSKSGFNHYCHIAEIVHKYNCKVSAQLHKNDTQFSGMFKYFPKMITGQLKEADIRSLLNQNTGKYISSLSCDEVKEITNSFGNAAVKAVEAGFDIIQVHGDRMCGSFSSSLFNSRTDEDGGSAENRARFAVESVQSIRNVLPNIPIDYKLVIRTENPDYGKAGILSSEIETFVKALENAGVSSFHVSLANHSKLEDTIPPEDHPDFYEEGCFLNFCDIVKLFTKLPVCGVGALSDPNFINNQLKTGRIDCAAMSRQLIADPQWVNKVLNNRTNFIYYCKRCNKECLGGMYKHKGVHCVYDNLRKLNNEI